MNLATWSIRNPIPVILLFILLTLAGLWGYRSLAIQNLPDVDLPTVSVSLVYPGAAPAQLETEVARKVENAVAAVAGLRHMTTTISDGQVNLLVEFELATPLNQALAETKDAIDGIRSDLPEDIQPPIVTAETVVGGAILTYAVASQDLDEEALSWIVDDAVSRAVLKVPGVGRIERVGGVDREIRVEIDPVRLAGLNITAADVSRALRSMQQENSGGRAQLSGGEQAVRVIATAATVSDFAALPIVVGARRIRLDQVATVHDVSGDRTQGALLNGEPAVGFSLYRARGADETRVADGVAEVLEALSREEGVSFTQVLNTVDHTREQFEGSMHMLIEGSILAVLVVFLFLRDWRATLIAATALPLSILPTFAAMYWLGFTLNTLTLLSLAVIIGILVDDAIVEVENIARHRQMGKPLIQAASDAVTEIALAVMATTLTLVAVFLPTALMPGLAGMFFRQFGWTAAIAVLASLLVARLVTPLMAARLLKDHPTKVRGDSVLMTRYLSLVRWSLTHRWITLAATLGLFAASVGVIPLLPIGLVPTSDQSRTVIALELPSGSAYPATLAAAESTRHAMAGIPGVASVFSVIGAGGEDEGVAEVRRATVTLNLHEPGTRAPLSQIVAQVRERMAEVPGVRYSVSGGDGSGEGLALILAGDDADALKQAAWRMEGELRSVGSLTSVSSTASLERAELVVRPHLDQAAERGVSTSDIGDTIRIATSGDYMPALARLNLENRQVPVRVRMADAARADPQALGNLRIPARDGAVPLSAIAAIGVESGPSRIDRYDRQRFITITADLNGMALGAATDAAMALPAVRELPPSVSIIETGEAELAIEVVSGFLFAFVAGVLCMFCVLVLLFKDALQPITILSAIPLALGGAFVALLVIGGELNLPVMIGLVLLTGVVTKNSILLVEHAIVAMRRDELGRIDALVEACRTRARPIIMTSVAMIAGMAPIALGLGADSSFRRPMAVAVIGGLVTSTLLSLVFVPTAFSLMASFEERLFGRPVTDKASRQPQEAS